MAEHCTKPPKPELVMIKKKAAKALLKTKAKKSAFLKLKTKDEVWCPTAEEEKEIAEAMD